MSCRTQLAERRDDDWLQTLQLSVLIEAIARYKTKLTLQIPHGEIIIVIAANIIPKPPQMLTEYKKC